MPYHSCVGEKNPARVPTNTANPISTQVALAATETAADHTTRRSCRGHGAGHSAPCLGHGNNEQKTSAKPPAVGLIVGTLAKVTSPAPPGATRRQPPLQIKRSCLSHRKHRTTRRAAAFAYLRPHPISPPLPGPNRSATTGTHPPLLNAGPTTVAWPLCPRPLRPGIAGRLMPADPATRNETPPNRPGRGKPPVAASRNLW